MTANDRAAEWVNGTGKREWQPVTAAGKRQWLEEVPDLPGHPPTLMPVWEYPQYATGLTPYRYRSRRRAARIARRYERREAAHTWKES